MRNFRNAAVASATALALIATGTTAALAQDSNTTPAGDASDRTVTHTGGRGDVAFNGFSQEGDKQAGEIISDAIEGSQDGVGSSRALSKDDTNTRFDGRDAFGKEKNVDNMPQWSRIWVDGTIIASIGALIGLIIAGFNYAKYTGIIPA